MYTSAKRSVNKLGNGTALTPRNLAKCWRDKVHGCARKKFQTSPDDGNFEVDRRLKIQSTGCFKKIELAICNHVLLIKTDCTILYNKSFNTLILKVYIYEEM